ncbi:MAG: hypothetical protein Kow00117_20790 [Phototrophicales bacterium]
MRRERLTHDIYVFTSDRYAQVTAGLVLTNEGAVIIGTLVYPQETRAIKQFVEERLKSRVAYVVNTHYHADHTTGTCFFEGAQVIAHELCYDLLNTCGRDSLEQARSSSPEMADVQLVLPNVLFSEQFTLKLGERTLRFWSTPGHTSDSIVCLVEEEQILFAADTLMPLPYFVDGDYDALVASLEGLKRQPFEAIVQGYGEVILRGEVEDKIQSDLDYLYNLRKHVGKALNTANPQDTLNKIDVEMCGKNRILMTGMAPQLHRQNVKWLAAKHTQPELPER